MPAAGVPDREAVPLPLSTKVTPVGRVPVSARAGVGLPVVVTVKLPAPPTVKVVVAGRGDGRGGVTVRVKLWVAGLPMPLWR